MTFAGIDFGTSNSTLGLADASGARLLPLEGDDVTLPSAVFFHSDDPQVDFGRAALTAYLEGEEGRLLRGLKSTLGSGLINDRTAIGSRAVSFRDVLARFIGHLRAGLDATAPGIDRASSAAPSISSMTTPQATPPRKRCWPKLAAPAVSAISNSNTNPSPPPCITNRT